MCVVRCYYILSFPFQIQIKKKKKNKIEKWAAGGRRLLLILIREQSFHKVLYTVSESPLERRNTWVWYIWPYLLSSSLREWIIKVVAIIEKIFSKSFYYKSLLFMCNNTKRKKRNTVHGAKVVYSRLLVQFYKIGQILRVRTCDHSCVFVENKCALLYICEYVWSFLCIRRK